MRAGSWRALWVLITWSGLAGALTAPGGGTAERGYSLEYRAAAGCPDVAALAHAIESRTPGTTRHAERAAVNLRVELREDGSSTLWVELPEGESRREFPPATCADAVASVAVVASMVLEAEASERRARLEAVMDRVAPRDSHEPPPTVNLPTAAPTRPHSPERKHASAATPRLARREPHHTRLRLALVTGLLIESAVAKNAPWGAQMGISASLEPRRPRVWVPSIQAEAVATLASTVPTPRGDVELRLLAGRLHLCPLRFAAGASLRLVPCLTADVGVLRARGTGQTVNPQDPSMPWVAFGGTWRAQLALGRVVGLESWLGLRGLARADTFVFSSPEWLAYRVPQWSLGAGLGLSLALP